MHPPPSNSRFHYQRHSIGLTSCYSTMSVACGVERKALGYLAVNYEIGGLDILLLN